MSGVLLRAGRLWRTVRWLKPRQWLGRVRLHLPYPTPRPLPAPRLRATAGAWVRPAARDPSLVGDARWRLLGQVHALDSVGWDGPQTSLLWRYNQHYFDDLCARDAGTRSAWQRGLVERWIADNPPRAGSTAWAPYPTSLRIVNWVKWFAGGAPPEPAWLQSLAQQARWLERRLEWHLLGNHLFANAKALVFAGLSFDGAEAERWLAAGQRIVERELPRQVLADGGHFERSPMYHALAFEDLLDLTNLLRARAATRPDMQRLAAVLHAQLAPMLRWLRCMAHPDGSLARFNDCADGIAPPVAELERYATALGVVAPQPPEDGVVHLADSGYVRLARAGAVAWLDVAPVGPDYLPGHAHADTLSFELSVRGRAVVVNRGTSEYGTGPRRGIERGTAAHSTLQAGAHDSSEMWAGFRVGRRARPRAVQVGAADVSASHDGYAFLPGAPLHTRRWRVDDGSLRVDDGFAAPRGETAAARFHLAPGLTPRADADGNGTDTGVDIVDGDGHTVARCDVERGRWRVESWQHALGFGSLAPAQTLVVALVDGAAVVRWRW